MSYSTMNPPKKIGLAYATAVYGGALPIVIDGLTNNTSSQLWDYISADSLSAIRANGYFNNGDFLRMSVGDVIFCRNIPGEIYGALIVSAVTAGGAATARYDANVVPSLIISYTWAAKPIYASVLPGTIINVSDIGGLGGSLWVATATGWVSKGPVLISQSYAPVTRNSNNTTDATFTVLSSVPIPAGLGSLNSKLIVVTDWNLSNSASVKYPNVAYGTAGLISGPSYTTIGSAKLMLEICNANSLTNQNIFNSVAFGTTGGSQLTTTVDTTAVQNINLQAKWGANVVGETITLNGYSIWHFPGNS